MEKKRITEAVKRNIERFPEEFRFQLTENEMAELVTNCKDRRQGGTCRGTNVLYIAGHGVKIF